jgi:uncharacterized delta-60 repeat protein
MARAALIALLAALLAWPAAAPASDAVAPGVLDAGFGTSGVSSVLVGGNGGANAVAVDTNGRIVTSGQTAVNPQMSKFGAARFNADGSLDTSFSGDGTVTINVGAASFGAGVLPLSDGRTVLTGAAYMPGSTFQFAAVRLLADGNLDPSFGGDGIVTQPIAFGAMGTVAFTAADGKIVLLGSATVSQATPVVHKVETLATAAIRLNEDGSLDKSFGNEGIALARMGTAAQGAALEADGDIVWAGETVVNGSRAFAAGRFTSSGQVDRGYGTDGVAAIPIDSGSVAVGVAYDPTDGSSVIVGPSFRKIMETTAVRLDANGRLAPSFGVGGIARVPTGLMTNGIVRAPDGDLVIATTGGMSALRLLSNGTPDPAFGVGGLARYPVGVKAAANGVFVAPDGRLLLGGVVFEADGLGRFAVARVHGDSVEPPVAEEPPPAAEPPPEVEPPPKKGRGKPR